MLTSELEQLVAHLRELDRSVVPLMCPGVDASSVAAILGAPVPVSVAEWFGWCNGVASRPGQVQDDVNVIPGYNLLSVEDSRPEDTRIFRRSRSAPELGAAARWCERRYLCSCLGSR